MNKTKCITFDKAAQDALPEHIKDKMKADRTIAKAIKLCQKIAKNRERPRAVCRIHAGVNRRSGNRF